MSTSFPPIAELLPQCGPMRLLERVLEHDASHTRCAVLPSESAAFGDDSGRVPVWVALEYMAQCAAADGGLRSRERGDAPRVGVLLGSRQLTFRSADFDPTRRLEVSARFAAGRGDHLAFDCAVHDPDGGPPLAEGRLNVLLADHPSLLKGLL